MEKYIKSLALQADIQAIALEVASGKRLTPEQGLTFLEHAPLGLLGLLAVQKKEQQSGKKVFYNINIHIEPTNICIFNCKFCSYRKAADHPDAWYYSLDKIASLASQYIGRPITEVHIVGGVHPAHTLADYVAMVRTVKQILPHVVVKAYTAVELYYIIKKAGLSLEQGLTMLRDAGMEAMPGGGAEIFDPQLRAQICPDKPNAQQWLQTHEVAHNLGITTNATILYGHIESYAHRIDHLQKLRHLQDLTHGFSAFIPLKYHAANNSMSHIGEVSLPEDMRMLAFSRLYLDNFPHIKAYWPMLGIQATELSLAFGANDIDGTIDDTTKIYSSAGGTQKPIMTTTAMRQLITRSGYTPVERDTFYNPV